MKLLLAAVLLLGTGCSTIGALSERGDHPWLFAGTGRNVDLFAQPGPTIQDGELVGNPYLPYQQLAAVCDFPWSLALDLVLLPFTIPLEIFDRP